VSFLSRLFVSRPLTDKERYAWAGGLDFCSWCGARMKVGSFKGRGGAVTVTVRCPHYKGDLEQHDYFRWIEGGAE